MQDTFIDAYKNLIQFKGNSNFKTWITRIMMNNCFRKKEKSNFKNEVVQDIPDNSKPAFQRPDNDTYKIVESHEIRHIIETALEKIPEDYRLVFLLREMNELSVSETAGLLNITEANVKVRLNRSKAMLRSAIEKSYSPSDLFEFNAIYCDAMTEKVMSIVHSL